MSEVINFGCRLNAYESQAISNMLIDSNITNAIVFNTCAVTSAAEKDARKAIRKAKKQHPDKKIIVTGCAAQLESNKFALMSEVDKVIGNSFKHDATAYLSSEPKIIIRDIMQDKEVAYNQIVSSFEDKTRAFLQVQNGCKHRCTFCIIPFARGNSRSVDPRRVIEEVKKIFKNGYNEIVLSGVDTTSYGDDFETPLKLGTLCKIILDEVPDLPRLRLSSVDVAEIDEDIIDLIKNNARFMPYLHISAQSGDNMILKRMKRRHTREMLIDFCHEMRVFRPEIAFGSDIIAGFPTENDAMFQNTCDMLEQSEMIFNHIFTYSERKNTPAAKMPAVAMEVRKERTRILINQTTQQMQKFMQNMIGTNQEILCENGGIGRCKNFAPVKIDNDYRKGQIIERKILGLQEKVLLI